MAEITAQLNDLKHRLKSCRQAAAHAERAGANAADEQARQCFELLADSWIDLAAEVERRLKRGQKGESPRD